MQACNHSCGTTKWRERQKAERLEEHTRRARRTLRWVHARPAGKSELSWDKTEGTKRKDPNCRLTHDGSQEGNVGETAVHRLIGRILQKIVTCKDDNPGLEFWAPSSLLFIVFTPHTGLHATRAIGVSRYLGWHAATRLIRQVGQLCCTMRGVLFDKRLAGDQD